MAGCCVDIDEPNKDPDVEYVEALGLKINDKNYA